MDRQQTRQKRSRSRSPPPWRQQTKTPRYDDRLSRRDNYQARRNQNQTMDREERDWVAKEDDFVLKQAKKKAQIRVREGRAKPIDWLAVILAVADLEEDILEDDGTQNDVQLTDPASIVDELGLAELQELVKDVEHYATLEKNRDNSKYWRALKSLIADRTRQLTLARAGPRGVGSVSEDVARLLAPKTKQQLDILEGQVRAKLRSDDEIDVEYWEHLLESIGVYKSKAELAAFYRNVLDRRITRLKQEQSTADDKASAGPSPANHQTSPVPRPLPDLSTTNRSEGINVDGLRTSVVPDRQRMQQTGFVPKALQKPTSADGTKSARVASGDASQITNAMYDREAARGIEDDEEVFAAEAEVPSVNSKKWNGTFKARKPLYFNRVQMGYEWNKYNQTHYDQENPPPKVVQGYKFNIFYPDLIDKTRAPTYKIEREHGRKRGESFAAAGEEDTCIIRFISGPPYEDLAFRIVDKEWDYSARRERGFISSFDKGTLQLHFQFKKVYYRK